MPHEFTYPRETGEPFSVGLDLVATIHDTV